MKNFEMKELELSSINYDDAYVRLSKNRIIFLNDDITKSLASELVALLLYYNNVDPYKDITLYINSNGGDIAGLINIYDIMQMIEAPIKTICLGSCYSAAAIILSAGTVGKRFAFKNSKIMIHGVQAEFPIPDHDMTNSKSYYEFLQESNDNVMKMLAKHTGQTLEKIQEDCKRDVWFNAREALNYGLIDGIL